MTLCGCARASSADQDPSLQEAALQAAGCQVVRAEKRTGPSREGRAELDPLMQFLRAGHTLVVTRIDQLARQRGLPHPGGLHAARHAVVGKGWSQAQKRLAQLMEAVQDVLPTWRGQNEQSMALAAVGFAKARRRRQIMVAAASIGPGATNMLTAAGCAHANRVNQLDIGWMASDNEDRVRREQMGGTKDWLAQASQAMPFGRLVDPAPSSPIASDRRSPDALAVMEAVGRPTSRESVRLRSRSVPRPRPQGGACWAWSRSSGGAMPPCARRCGWWWRTPGDRWRTSASHARQPMRPRPSHPP